MRKVNVVIGIILLGAVFLFFGCAHQAGTDLDKQLSMKNQEIQQLKASNQEKAAALADSQRKLEAQSKAASEADMRANEAMAAKKAAEQGKSPGMAAGGELLPPGAQPGECYARLYMPPSYRTVTETMIKRGESETVEVVPARYEWVEEEVLVQAASQRVEVVPAQYEWAEEQVLVKEASSRMEEVPARYEWAEEQVLVKPAETVWKKGRGPIEKLDYATGEIMCLVEIPAVYKNVKKKIMVSPPRTTTVEIPAEYKSIKKKVMVKPPTTQTIEIPAVYKTVKVRKMVASPQEMRTPIPAEYQTVTKTEKVSDGHMEWRRIMCETNVTPGAIKTIQLGLRDAGHDPGAIDGVYGGQTQAAVKTYQREKGLAVGALTYETLKSLGVDLRAN